MSSEFAPRSRLAYHVWPSALGPLGLVARDDKLAGVFLDIDPQTFPFEVERTYGSPGRRDEEPFQEVIHQLKEYFAGKRLVFRVPLDLGQGTPFQKRAWKALLDIPYGRTLSYKDLAKTIGQPSAGRAVGGAIGANPIPIVIPCHRVIASDGTIGGYSGGTPIKKRLLELENRTSANVISMGLPRVKGNRPTRER